MITPSEAEQLIESCRYQDYVYNGDDDVPVTSLDTEELAQKIVALAQQARRDALEEAAQIALIGDDTGIATYEAGWFDGIQTYTEAIRALAQQESQP